MKKKLINFKNRFLKPFWFSSKCNYVKVPYVYGFAIMALFITSIIVFIDMALSQKYSSGTLASLSSVIGILAGLYFGTLKLYNHGVELKARQNNQMYSEGPVEDTPPSNPVSTIINTITKKVGRPKKQEVD